MGSCVHSHGMNVYIYIIIFFYCCVFTELGFSEDIGAKEVFLLLLL